MNSAPSGFFISNRMGRIFLQATHETIGDTPLRSMPDFVRLALPGDEQRAFPFETVSQLHSALENVYGQQSGRGLAVLIGRACFKYGIRQFSDPLGFNETDFRLLPHVRKLQTAAQACIALLHAESDLRIQIEQREGKLLCRVERCPLCHQRASDSPACHLVVGLLQESLGWLSGGKIFNIKETLCIARGEPTCTFEIDLNPIT